MQPKRKPCLGECNGELRIIWKNHQGKRYCKDCWVKIKPGTPAAPKKHYEIPKRSKKRVSEEAEYSKRRKLFLLANPVCQAHLPTCSSQATEIHHKRGKIGRDLIDMTNFLAVCRQCHHIIETKPILAKELGFSESRLT
jgi:hypothetical protein